MIARRADSNDWSGSFIEFRFDGFSKSGLTGLWTIYEKNGVPLGTIKWFPRWRKYAFYPNPDTLYENVCLGEIAEFIALVRNKNETILYLI